MSQSALAKKAVISKSHLSEIESGKKTPSFEMLEKICLALNIPKELVIIQSFLESDYINQTKTDEVTKLKNLLNEFIMKK
jgi:transcriptional regulator with XRE-family HTH domain